MTKEKEVIVKHLRKSREMGIHILENTPGKGSAIIEHKFKLVTQVSERVEMISEITFMPGIRLYKEGENKIVDDEDLLKEDVENVVV